MGQAENKLSGKIMKALRERGCFVFKVHGGPTQQAGIPDIIGFLPLRYGNREPRSRGLAIEVKLPGELPTELQHKTLLNLASLGVVSGIASSVAEALAIINLQSVYTGEKFRAGSKTGKRSVDDPSNW